VEAQHQRVQSSANEERKHRESEEEKIAIANYIAAGMSVQEAKDTVMAENL